MSFVNISQYIWLGNCSEGLDMLQSGKTDLAHIKNFKLYVDHVFNREVKSLLYSSD